MRLSVPTPAVISCSLQSRRRSLNRSFSPLLFLAFSLGLNFARNWLNGGMPFRPEKIPLDILYPILEHLNDRLDLHAAALTSRCFNAAATPLLYRKLDTRTKWEDKAVRCSPGR